MNIQYNVLQRIMENIFKKESAIEENNKIVKEEERKKEETKSHDDFYSLVDKAYYVNELHYKIGTQISATNKNLLMQRNYLFSRYLLRKHLSEEP